MKAIIFDMDGVIIDSEKLYFETEKEIAKKYNIEISEDILKELMGRSPQEAASVFLKKTAIPLTVSSFLLLRDQIMEYKYNHQAEPLFGLIELLEFVDKKFDLAIATGSPEKFLNLVIDKLNIRKYFKILQSSDSIKKGKPDPEIYLTVIDKLKLNPKDCIVIEDSVNGSLAGKNAGCYTIAVFSEYTKDQSFDFVDYFAKDLVDVKNHIEKKFC